MTDVRRVRKAAFTMLLAVAGALAPAMARAQVACTSPPPLVQNIVAQPVSASAVLRWDPLGDSHAVTGYTVAVAASADGQPIAATTVGRARAHHIMLAEGRHYLRVRARNACGDGPFSPGIEVVVVVAGACQAAPAQPRNLRARREAGSLIWTWEPPSGGEREDRFILELGSWPGGSDLGVLEVNGYTHVVPAAASEIHGRIRGRNACGLGAPSDDAVVAGAAKTYERASTDRPDDVGGYEVKVLYVLPSDGEDRRLDVDGTLVRSVAAFRKWFERRSGQSIRIDTAVGIPDIGFVRLARTDAQIASVGAFVRDEIQRDLRSAGYDDPRKIYAVYYGGGSSWACGGGAWPPTLIGGVAALYLNGTPSGAPPCNTNRFTASVDQVGYLEFAMLHEIVHTLGLVAACAPNHTRQGHTSDNPADLMYAGDQPWRPSALDINYDDYFAHGRSCADLRQSVFLWPSTPTAGAPQGWTTATSPARLDAGELAEFICRLMPEGPRPH
jgi:hypothetical protein